MSVKKGTSPSDFQQYFRWILFQRIGRWSAQRGIEHSVLSISKRIEGFACAQYSSGMGRKPAQHWRSNDIICQTQYILYQPQHMVEKSKPFADYACNSLGLWLSWADLIMPALSPVAADLMWGNCEGSCETLCSIMEMWATSQSIYSTCASLWRKHMFHFTHLLWNSDMPVLTVLPRKKLTVSGKNVMAPISPTTALKNGRIRACTSSDIITNCWGGPKLVTDQSWSLKVLLWQHQ